jgi:hypothetical protein
VEAAEVEAAEVEAAEVEAAEVEAAEVEAAEVETAEVEAAGVVVAATEVEAAWQRVAGVLEGRSREFRGFRVGMQVVLLRAQKVEEQWKERVWVAGVGWSKGVMCNRLEQIVQYTRWLRGQQEWLEAVDEQEVQQKEYEEKAAEEQQKRQQQKRQQREQQRST